MRPQNIPLSKNSNAYKSSAMLRKVSPQQTIMESNMIESKTKLSSVKSQQNLRITSDRQLNSVKSSQKLPQVTENNFVGVRSTSNLRSGIADRPRTEQKAYTFDNEDEYIGQWEYDQTENKQKPHGYGCYKFKKERIEYRGYFKNGLMHGSGTLHRLLNRGKPQIIYEGEWMYGEKNGSGRYYYDDNTLYAGNWNKNKKQGQGRFKSPEGEYEGLWINDKKHGKGVLRMANGTIYEGQWDKDEMISGQIRYSNGDVYRGQINEQFQRHLQGQYAYGSNQENYKGTWRNNRKQGQGEITYGINGERYTGQMRNDNREGSNCSYEWKNGSKMIGIFQNNFPVRGKLILPDNSSYDFDCTQEKLTKNRV